MSIESIRLQANDPDVHFATVDKAEAEALCDLADAAWGLIAREPNEASHSPNRAMSSCLVCGEDWPCPTFQVRQALRRLDAERGG